MPEQSERWKDIFGYEGLYQISDIGRVRSLDREVSYYNKRYFNGLKPMRYLIKGIQLRYHYTKAGYVFVPLYKNGIMKQNFIHRLIAIAFIKNPHNKPEVNHKDCDPKNNNVFNLEWCTRKENAEHAKENNRYKIPKSVFKKGHKPWNKK